jgi:hypothetical protein
MRFNIRDIKRLSPEAEGRFNEVLRSMDAVGPCVVGGLGIESSYIRWTALNASREYKVCIHGVTRMKFPIIFI